MVTRTASLAQAFRPEVHAMVHPHDNQTQTRWDKGEFKVMLMTPASSKPMGFCDGSAADVAELTSAAEAENATLRIEKKLLKTGREVWTLHGA